MKSFSALLFASLLPALNLMADPSQRPLYEPDGKPLPTTVQAPANQGVRLIPVSMRQRFNRDVLTGLPTAAQSLTMRGWRGETVQAQVLVEAPAGIQSLSAATTAGRVTVRPIRYTTGNGVLLPDVIDTFEGQSFKGVVRPLLLSYSIPTGVTSIGNSAFAN